MWSSSPSQGSCWWECSKCWCCPCWFPVLSQVWIFNSTQGTNWLIYLLLFLFIYFNLIVCLFVVCFVQSSMNIKHSCKWMGNVSKMHLYFSWTTAYPAPGNAEKIKSWKTQYQNSHYHSKCVLLESIFRSNVLLISKPSSQTPPVQACVTFPPSFY